MNLTSSLGGEIKDYISNLIGRDSQIVDLNGVCITSPKSEEIGKKICEEKIEELKESKSFKNGQLTNLLIPLEYQNEVVAALIFQDDDQKTKEYLPLIKSFAELLINQYYENNKPLLDSTDQFVIKLLNNAHSSEYPFYESEAKVLGYDLSSRRIGIVMHLDGFWEKCLLSTELPSFERDEVIKHAKKNIETAINGFFSRNNDIIIAYLGNDKFVVFKSVNDIDEDEIKKFLKKSFGSIFEPLKNYRIKNISVGYGNAYSGISGLISSYREANLSLELGLKLWGNDKSYFFGDLGLLTVLGEGNREKNVQFSKQLLNRMKNEELNKTLDCFFNQNLNLTETADEMGVHRNTIIYRLNKISKILGADPRVFEQAMSIKIALLIQKLFR